MLPQRGFTHLTTTVIGLGLLLTASALAADEATTEPKSSYDILNTETLTGDWGGVRTDLEEAGVQLKIKVMNQYMVNMHGGLETSNGSDFAGNYELNLYFDFEKLNLIPDAFFFIRGKGTWGGDDSDFDREKIGGLFKTNADAATEEPIYVDKWWYTQFLADNKVEIRAGRIAATVDLFDTSEIIGSEDCYFLNSALVTNSVIPGSKGLGLYVNYNVLDWMYVRAAVIDAQARSRRTGFDTAFHGQMKFNTHAEMGFTPSFNAPWSEGALKGRYRVGTWHTPMKKNVYIDNLGGRLAARHNSSEWGWYFGFDQKIWNEAGNEDQGLSLAGRYGRARSNTNRIDEMWTVAVKYDGPVPGRDKDHCGFGVSQGIQSDDYALTSAGADRETVYEIYYNFQVLPWLSISPDVQFIQNTGGNADGPDTTVGGIRVQMSL